jgi:REP element-mobilizing transposase RayT
MDAICKTIFLPCRGATFPPETAGNLAPGSSIPLLEGVEASMKYHPHGSVLFSTFSIEQGLLLLCNPLCEAIIKSCLARAQSLYPVRICAIIIEANHVHLVFVVDNPDDVPSFIRHFKTESAHALNKILGRRKRTIWCEGYDSPVVLTLVRALLVLSYLYSNPAKDNLEESIDKYPGISSWKMFLSGEHTKKWKRIHRPAYRALGPHEHNLEGYTREARRLERSAGKTHSFTLEPNAWLEAFGITDPEEQRGYNQRLIERVRAIEARAARVREREKKRVIGADKLRESTFNLTHQSSRSGKRMWCLSEQRSLRVRFISFLKELKRQARVVQQNWRRGDFSLPYPLGLYTAHE